MLSIKIEVNVAYTSKSIPEVARDSPSGKRIDLNAALGLTVMAALGWVVRKTVAVLLGDFFDE